jgi:hypothetical protein
MKRSDLLKAYQDFSGLASTNTRNLDFAGIAVVWIFRTEGTKGQIESLPSFLFLPLAGFVLSLFLDLSHYVYAALAWGVYHRLKEWEGGNADDEFTAPSAINYPSIAFFWSKIILCLVGYALLFIYVISRLMSS